MSARTARRPEGAAFNAASLRSDREYRLDPDSIAMVARRPDAGAGLITRAITLILVWRDRAYSRRALASCDERMLRDIGISSGDAGYEAGKPFWRS